MEVTIEIDDQLYEEATALAAEQHTTVTDLVEAGLRKEIAARRGRDSAFRLADRSFGHGGSGLQPPFSDDDWGAIRRFTYEDGRVGGDGPTPEWAAATWDEKLRIIYGDRT